MRVSLPLIHALPGPGSSLRIQKKVSPSHGVDKGLLASGFVHPSRILCSERCSISVVVIRRMSRYFTGIGQFSSVGTNRVVRGVVWTIRAEVSVMYHLSGRVSPCGALEGVSLGPDPC